MAGLPRRKPNRLPGFDYSAPGAYFITICTHEKRCFLSRINVGAIHESPAEALGLTGAGRCVEAAITALPQRYPGLTVEKYVIMPNHIHLLLRLEASPALRELPGQANERHSVISKAVGFLKMTSSKQIHLVNPGLDVWQRSFHDHVIRNEKEYLMIWNYIDGNPLKWTDDCFYPNAESRGIST